MIRRDAKVYYSAGSLFLLTISRPDRRAEIRWSVCISKSQRTLCISFYSTHSELCMYYLLVWSIFNIIIIIIVISISSSSISSSSLLIWEFFYISVSWWFSTGVWVTANLLKSPGLFLVFWPISKILQLDSLCSSSYSQVFRFLYQSFCDCTECTNYNWYHCHFHVLLFFCLSSFIILIIQGLDEYVAEGILVWRAI